MIVVVRMAGAGRHQPTTIMELGAEAVSGSSAGSRARVLGLNGRFRGHHAASAAAAQAGQVADDGDDAECSTGGSVTSAGSW